jgi:hypothetical protein
MFGELKSVASLSVSTAWLLYWDPQWDLSVSLLTGRSTLSLAYLRGQGGGTISIVPEIDDADVIHYSRRLYRRENNMAMGILGNLHR